MDLRPYQVEAVEGILDYALRHPTGRLLVVCPPGSGKTLIAATTIRLMVVMNRLRGLVVAHRREIIDTHFDHLLACDVPRDMLGVIRADDKRRNTSGSIQIASIDTLNRRNKPEAQFLLTDESHRDASKSRRKLQQLYPNAFKLGFTATPIRYKGGLGDSFDEMLVVSSPSELIAEGYMASPRVFTVPEELLPDLSSVRVVEGDYEQGSLEKVMNQRALVGNLVDHWLRLADGARTVVFATSIAHSWYIVENFGKAGIPSAHLDTHATSQQRLEILAALKEGALKVVSCVDVLSEGWDCPPCKCVVQARPTKSTRLHIQQCGRCTRPWDGVVPLILDHAGNMIRHGLPQMDREWSLAEGLVETSGEAPCKVCVQCTAVVPLGCDTCPECKLEFPKSSPILEETPGELEEAGVSDSEMLADYDRVLEFARQKKFADPEEWAKKFHQRRYHKEYITIQPTPEQKVELIKAATAAGMGVSTWIRMLAMQEANRQIRKQTKSDENDPS